MLYAVVMAGGSGRRFWPKSRKGMPKQFLPIGGKRTMIEETLGRFEGFIPKERIYIVTSAELKDLTESLLPDVPRENILAEPVGRDTAACIGLAATVIGKEQPEAVLTILPADHIISPREKFQNALKIAEEEVRESGVLLTFGIVPTSAHTGYGYIKRGDLTAKRGGLEIYEVAAFKEKPDRKTAEMFLASGEYYWNSGIFMGTAGRWLEGISRCLPRLGEALSRIKGALGKEDFEKVLQKEYEPLEKISIDYGVMEKTKDVKVMEVDFEWDDVGSWSALRSLQSLDKYGNAVTGEHLGIDTNGCTIVGEEGHIVATIGVSDLIIIETKDATLVCSRERAQQVKDLVNLLEKKGFDKYL